MKNSKLLEIINKILENHTNARQKSGRDISPKSCCCKCPGNLEFIQIVSNFIKRKQLYCCGLPTSLSGMGYEPDTKSFDPNQTLNKLFIDADELLKELEASVDTDNGGSGQPYMDDLSEMGYVPDTKSFDPNQTLNKLFIDANELLKELEESVDTDNGGSGQPYIDNLSGIGYVPDIKSFDPNQTLNKLFIDADELLKELETSVDTDNGGSGQPYMDVLVDVNLPLETASKSSADTDKGSYGQPYMGDLVDVNLPLETASKSSVDTDKGSSGQPYDLVDVNLPLETASKSSVDTDNEGSGQSYMGDLVDVNLPLETASKSSADTDNGGSGQSYMGVLVDVNLPLSLCTVPVANQPHSSRLGLKFSFIKDPKNLPQNQLSLNQIDESSISDSSDALFEEDERENLTELEKLLLEDEIDLQRDISLDWLRTNRLKITKLEKELLKIEESEKRLNEELKEKKMKKRKNA